MKLFTWGVFIVGGLMGLGYWLTPEADRIAEEYHISKDKVVINPKPHGCDFDDAPLGNKHCHYEKEVVPYKGCDRPDCPVTSVFVSWRKVEE